MEIPPKCLKIMDWMQVFLLCAQEGSNEMFQKEKNIYFFVLFWAMIDLEKNNIS